LIPVAAIGLLAVGAIGGGALGAGFFGEVAVLSPFADGPSETPTASQTYDQRSPLEEATFRIPPVYPVGELDAAERWFSGEQTAEDVLPMPIDIIEPTTSRLVLQAPGEDAWSAWIGRSTNEVGFCLSVFHPEIGFAESTCASAADFVARGLGMATSTGVTINWNGTAVSATRTR
jgi:hypothetical protein